MADEIDRAQEREQHDREIALAAAKKPLDPGVPGNCDFCDEFFSRLIGGACGGCRDRYRLP